MPYKSREQAAYMHIHHPDIAARWDAEIHAAKRKKRMSKSLAELGEINKGLSPKQIARLQADIASGHSASVRVNAPKKMYFSRAKREAQREAIRADKEATERGLAAHYRLERHIGGRALGRTIAESFPKPYSPQTRAAIDRIVIPVKQSAEQMKAAEREARRNAESLSRSRRMT